MINARFFQLKKKVVMDTIKYESPKELTIINLMVVNLPWTNIASNGNTQDAIKVAPVAISPQIISFNALFFFRAPSTPLLLSALVKIVMAAKTKPNRIPETVERTPATDIILE